jgi:hypothetical protein
MGALLESGLVGNIGLKHLKVIKEDTINKWDKLGFLEGLNGHQKENVAQLFENQASYLINEAAHTDSAGSFETVVFPIVRRVFSKLLANDIVSVQAMNLPIGKLFFFVPKVQDRKPESNDGVNGHYKPFGYPGAVDYATSMSGYEDSKNLYDRFYEDGTTNSGMFDYSKGDYIQGSVTGGAVETIDGVAVTHLTTPTALVDAAGDAIALSKVKLDFKGFEDKGAGKLHGPNGQEVDSEEFLASLTVKLDGKEVDFRVVTQKYGKGIVGGLTSKSSATTPGGQFQQICDADGIIHLEVDVEKYDATEGWSAQEVVLGDFKVLWRQYSDLEFEDAIGEVSFDLESVTVSVTERKLRASWSPELAQDVSAFHNIDAEAELTALLSEQVAAEIDREILRDLRKGAAWQLKWDYNEWKYGNDGASFAGYTQKDWNQTLITKINQVSAQIHKSTLRGGANWIVVSSEVSAVFDDLEYFHVSNASPEQDSYNMGIEKVGTLAGRYQVYRDPYFPAGKILMGHKGTSLLDTGYVYAPYVPLQLTPTMYNPFNFTPIKGIMTRYAKKMVNNRFYGVISVAGLQSFDISELR